MTTWLMTGTSGPLLLLNQTHFINKFTFTSTVLCFLTALEIAQLVHSNS